MAQIILDILTVASLFFGLFFMFIGALGIWRLPDFFNRMHAGSKCLTLGISGTLIAAVLHLSTPHAAAAASGDPGWGTIIGAITKAVLVIVFQYTAAPVGAHMLARAAHVAGVPRWEGTLDDELEVDRAREQ